MKTLLLILALMLPGSVLAEGVLTPAANPFNDGLYDYRTRIELQDDFISGGYSNAGVIGQLGWGMFQGASTVQSSEANRLGIMRRDNATTSGLLVATFLLNGNASGIPAANPHDLKFLIRLNTNDANTMVRIGGMNSYATDPPTDGIYFEKLLADTNWFCITRNSGTQTRTDSGVAVSTSFVSFAYKKTSTGVNFFLDDVPVCGTIATNITTIGVDPAYHLSANAAALKTIDIDYAEVKIYGIARR